MSSGPAAVVCRPVRLVSVDGTPVLDIKPCVPRFGVRQTERVGWFGDRLDPLPRIRSDDRMA